MLKTLLMAAVLAMSQVGAPLAADLGGANLAGVDDGVQLIKARKTCKKGFTAMPDERGGGRIVCISNKEKRKAVKICSALGQKDWRQCTCQDANTVGACGD